MDYNFTIPRLLLLISLLAIFGMLGGFIPPVLPEETGLSSARVTKAWFYCVLMFLSGAISTSIVDHHVGLIDRINLRLLYIIIGVGLMIGSIVWLRSLRETADDKLSMLKAGTLSAID